MSNTIITHSNGCITITVSQKYFRENCERCGKVNNRPIPESQAGLHAFTLECPPIFHDGSLHYYCVDCTPSVIEEQRRKE